MKLYVVGIGPGELSQITPAAMAAMEESDVIAGYTVYVGPGGRTGCGSVLPARNS